VRFALLILATFGILLATASPARAGTAAESRSTTPAGAHRTSVPTHAAARPQAGTRASAKTDSAAAIAHAGARTLEDIHIEGEIPVPQVLFITAREQRRFMEFQHHRYLKNSREVGAATVPPSRIVMTRANDAGKEPSR
jgi:hypothetical protein